MLKSPQKKAEYDQIKASQAASGHKRERSSSWTDEDEVSRQFSEFFEATFGSGATGRGGYRASRNNDAGNAFSERGKDLQHRVTLYLEEAVKGTQRTLKLKVPTSDAQGQQHFKTKTLKVKIPAGVVPKQRIRLTGQGGAGLGGGPNGDLLLEIELAPHPLFAVQGRDILLDLPVAPWEAALGAKLEIPTVTGPVNLTISEGSVSGKKLRLKGRGLGLNPSGDLLVNLQVSLPPEHSNKTKALYRQLAELKSTYNPRKLLDEWL